MLVLSHVAMRGMISKLKMTEYLCIDATILIWKREVLFYIYIDEIYD